MINLRWNRLPAALLAAGLLLTTSLRADSAYMVTDTDIDKDTTTYEVLDRAGLSALKEKIKLETRHFPAALAAAKKEWESNDLTKGNAFPAAKLSPRKLREEGPFDAEVARKKADKKAERDMNRDFDKNAEKKGGANKAKPSEKELEKLARQAQKDELIASAAELVRKHLEQLTTAAK